MYGLIMKTMSLIFFMIRKQNPRLKCNLAKFSSLVKLKLCHIDVYDGAPTE